MFDSMLLFISGLLAGILLMFLARLADKDMTRLVDRYGASGSVWPKKPIIVRSSEDTATPEDIMRELNDSV